MLINLPFKNGDVVSMKLASGEEILCKLEEEKGNTYIISRPLMLTPTQQGVGLAPFMFTVSPDAKYTINNSTVMCVSKTEDDYAKQYLQSTTGIAV